MVTVGLLAFLGIVAASSFDSKSWLAHYRLKAAVRNLEMNFQFARMEAVKRNTYCTITFRQVLDGETYDYVVYVDDNPNPDIGTASTTAERRFLDGSNFLTHLTRQV